MKLWQKQEQEETNGLREKVESFTTGTDQTWDQYLAPFDVLGSMAHARMLADAGLIKQDELRQLYPALLNIYAKVQDPGFVLDPGIEDIHSQVECMLTKELGETGKKIHTARSRNDQVLVDIKMYMRHELEILVTESTQLFRLLQSLSERYKDYGLPGYTHLQLAMPSSFGLWFGAYAESLVDDMELMQAAYRIVNQNPLGSAAGYGTSFPINRTITTRLLGFGSLNYNVVYAQMTRGKSERVVAGALANLAATLSKLAMDACLYLNQHFAFISFPDELTTGSSIMPHKKNPDVFELIRATCNRVQALPQEVTLLTTNLPSGYHRDMQLIKEIVFPAFKSMLQCIQMTRLMLEHIQVKKDILAQDQYKFLFSVEAVNKLVGAGKTFRDAYREVGMQIENGTYEWSPEFKHTHQGSAGNLCTVEIEQKMNGVLEGFAFESVHNALSDLLAYQPH